MKNLTLFIVLYVFFTQNSMCQLKEKEFRSYTKKDGISTNDVTSFAQTPDGYLWIGTTDGLNRFDGYSFKVFRHNSQDSTSLSDNHVSELFVDHKGVLWIGTEAKGLNRYISENEGFECFNYVEYDPSSLSSYFITSIVEDVNQSLWVGTIMGLNKFERSTNTFKRYFHETELFFDDRAMARLKASNIPSYIVRKMESSNAKNFPNIEQFISFFEQLISKDSTSQYIPLVLQCALMQSHADHIRVVEPDTAGNLWIGYEQGGLAYFNPNSNRLHMISFAENDVPEPHVSDLWLDGQTLWIGEQNGRLSAMNVLSRQASFLTFADPPSTIEGLHQDLEGYLWVGTDQGVYKVGSNDSSMIQEVLSYPETTNEFSTSSAKSLFEDREQNVWVGFAQGGIYKTSGNSSIHMYVHHQFYPQGLYKNSISAVMEDADENVWIGYYTGGLDIWKTQEQLVEHYPSAMQNGAVGEGTVYSIFQDANRQVWVGSYDGGLRKFDSLNKRFSKVYSDAEQVEVDFDIRDMVGDSTGIIWMATHGHGLIKYDSKSGNTEHFYADYLNWESSLANDWTYTLALDRNNKLWIGSVWGISVFEDAEGTFKTFNNENSNLSHNRVRVVFEDHEGRVWVGTESGLNRVVDSTGAHFQVYTTDEGLLHANVVSIEEDQNHRLWVVTKGGICWYNERYDRFEAYLDDDLFMNNEPFHGASCFGSSRTLYVGGNRGLISFQPHKIETDSTEIPVHITHLTYSSHEDSVHTIILGTTFPKDTSLSFSHKQNTLNFHYVGINLTSPEKILYAYQLEGFDQAWHYPGDKLEANYTNLPSGSYVFKVMVTNLHGVWSDNPVILRINIDPPVWKTVYAKIAYVILFVLSIYLYRRWVIHRETQKNEEEIERVRTNERANLHLAKMQFLAQVSNEFRAPLALIQDPLSKLMESDEWTNQGTSNYLSLISRNTERLMSLVDQFQKLSEPEHQLTKLHLIRYDLVNYCRRIVEVFKDQAIQKHIVFDFEANKAAVEVYFDPGKVESILYNLISAVFKHLPEHGFLKVELYVGTSGIDQALQYQRPEALVTTDQHAISKITFRYTGIKFTDEMNRILDWVKQLVEAHCGSFRFTKDREEGVITYQMLIPVDLKGLGNTKISFDHLDYHGVSGQADLHHQSIQGKGGNVGKPKILLIDHDEDFRSYVKLQLLTDFHVEECGNGHGILEKAVEKVPNVIVLELIIDGVDGVALCQELKSDSRTAHIPVVFLTSKSMPESILQGLMCGADDYIVKSSSTTYIRFKLLNLVASRKKMVEHLIASQHAPAGSDPREVDFTVKLHHMIHQYLTDDDFGPERLAQLLHMSRSQLYKKVKDLSGESVSLLIRKIRLQKAAELLTNSEMSVAEVAYAVGFNDPGYFTKCFKLFYGRLPSDYGQALWSSSGLNG